MKPWKLFALCLGNHVMFTKLQHSLLQTVFSFMACGRHDVWCESLSHCVWKSASAGGLESQEARTCDQSAPVSGEGGDQSFMAASVFVAFSSSSWCSGTASASKSKSFNCSISMCWCKDAIMRLFLNCSNQAIVFQYLNLKSFASRRLKINFIVLRGKFVSGHIVQSSCMESTCMTYSYRTGQYKDILSVKTLH